MNSKKKGSVKSSGIFEFVHKVKASKDYFCPITNELMLKPHLTECCGHHLSSKAVEEAKKDGAPCPFCNSTSFNTVLDKCLQRNVHGLKIRCTHRKEGCRWTGEIASLEMHFGKEDPDEDDDGIYVTICSDDTEYCQYEIVPCTYMCGGKFKRLQLTDHTKNHCAMRPFACEFCDFKGSYREVTRNHWPECANYLLPCPNVGCGKEKIKQRYLKRHLEEECLFHVKDCPFAFAGCRVRLESRSLDAHIEESATKHLLLVTKFSSTQIPRLQKSLEELTEVVHAQAKTIETLQFQVNSLMDLESIYSDDCLVPPVDMAVQNFEELKGADGEWHSPPFYSSRGGGYKLSMRIVPNGRGQYKGTHVSVFVHLMRGQYDNDLKWPFRGTVFISLLDQSSTENHYEKTICFDDKVRPEVTCRVPEGEEINNNGWGFHFISHEELAMRQSVGGSGVFLDNNCVKFRVSCVTVDMHGTQTESIDIS